MQYPKLRKDCNPIDDVISMKEGKWAIIGLERPIQEGESLEIMAVIDELGSFDSNMTMYSSAGLEFVLNLSENDSNSSGLYYGSSLMKNFRINHLM